MDMSVMNIRPPVPPAAQAPIPAKGTPEVPNPAAADKVAKEFEAMIVGQLMDSMFAGMKESALFGGGGPAEKPWRSMLLQEYGKAIAEAGTLGIGRMTRDEVARLYARQAESAS